MAQLKYDLKNMPHEEFAELGESWAEERDTRVKRLTNADKPTRRLRNGSEQPEAS